MGGYDTLIPPPRNYATECSLHYVTRNYVRSSTIIMCVLNSKIKCDKYKLEAVQSLAKVKKRKKKK